MKKSVIVYGTNSGVQKKALEVLSQILLDATGEYPACVSSGEYVPCPERRPFFVGTRENHGYIRRTSKAKLTYPEEYAITVCDDTVIIEGSDDAGVLYGCVDFYNRYLTQHRLTHRSDPYFQDIFQAQLPDDFIQSHPDIRHRGLWTWGHVIYDYRGYIDNMVRLKMNTVIIWNDHVPCNAAEVVAYAHESNVKVIWGFAWLWSTNCSNVSMDMLAAESRRIADLYEREYAHLQGDGIYFQSFTELDQEYIDGVLIADAVTRFVNDTAALIFEKHPQLELQFGLHANSVSQKLAFIRNTDPRIRIVWENCGAFPFDYLPEQVANFRETKEFVGQITRLRGDGERFGVVLKGLTKLDWNSFEHQAGPAFLGTSSRQMQQNRLDRKRKIWHLMQAGWIVHGDKAYEMICLLRDQTGGNLHVTALVEDGMFEKKLYYPVALLGEMLWDCGGDLTGLTYRVAMRDNVEFA